MHWEATTRPQRDVIRVTVFLIGSLSLVAPFLLGPTPASAQPSLVDPQLTLETIATGLGRPVNLAFVGPDDILVLQKDDGRVRRILGGVLQPDALDVPVANDSERGLLGIAVNSEEPPAVFLYYTEAASDGGTAIANRIYRYTWNPVAGTLDSPALVKDLPVSPGPNHDGGNVLLGKPGKGPPVGDGAFLYAVIGDLNRNGQLENFAAGAAADDTAVVLRMLQDGSPAPGNPFTPYCSVTTTQTCPGGGGCPGGETCITEVASYVAYGVRNSFGLAIDRVTGDLWDTENGPTSYDEVNRLAPGTNSGWEQIMGPDARDPQGVGNLFDMPGAGSTYSDPEFSWLSTIAPTAIVFPFASALGAGYDDVALVGDNNLGQIYAFPLDASREGFDLSGFTGLSDLVADSAAERNQLLFGSGFGGSFGGVTDLEVGPDRALYVLALGSGNNAGALYRITGPPRPVTSLPPGALFSAVIALTGLALWAFGRTRHRPAAG